MTSSHLTPPPREITHLLKQLSGGGREAEMGETGSKPETAHTHFS